MSMAGVIVGSGQFTYEALAAWQQMPEGVSPKDSPAVAVNSRDDVYVMTRNTAYPVMVFDRDGNYLRTFGEGVFSERTHALFISPDDSVWCADDGTHTLTKWSANDKLLLTIGTPGQPAPKWSGKPFNRPTHAVASPHTGDIFISDGYGNSHMHKYSAKGEYIKTWGGTGIDAGQFIWPHNVAIDARGRVLVADREAHRVQLFDEDGKFLTMWNNIHRPDGMTIGPDGNIYIGELNGMAGPDDGPGLGHRVSILSPDGALLARLGDAAEGEGPGQFIAPHGVAVDSRGDIYVGEVSYTIRGSRMKPPRELRSLSKLRKVG